MNVSIIGLGKLGASMVAGFASKQIRVIGYDVNHEAVRKMNNGVAPVEETGLQELLSKHKDNISATDDLKEAVNKSEVSFIIVPTPSLRDGSFDLSYIKRSCEAIGLALKTKRSYHLVVITSTVLPGATRNALIPTLERTSGKRAGKHFGVCYNPEFIALGSVIRDFLNPDFYLVGEFDKRSGDCLTSVHNKISDGHAPVKRMTIENAELAKISINSYVTLKISFANMLSEFCEKLEGGDVDSVTSALGMDSRIGKKYLKGGLGFAGPCFPRDNRALSQLGDKLGVYSGLLKENDNYNNQLTNRQIEKIRHFTDAATDIAILGLAYKPFSFVTEKSPSVIFARDFLKSNRNLSVHDPLSHHMEICKTELKPYVCDSIEATLTAEGLILLMHPTVEYVNALESFAGKNEITIIDFWRALPNKFGKATIKQVGVDEKSRVNLLSQIYSGSTK